EARDLGDLEVLVAAAEAAGLDGPQARAYLESDKDAEAVKAEDARARQIGIQGVPTYILAGKYVLSGAHPPEVLFHMFELGQQEDAAAAEAPADG
ncbi:MAG: DsbA family protein, partial [Rhodospirillales bacterium]|nr:DsbA family protein [Rhodospirillales bacterium]